VITKYIKHALFVLMIACLAGCGGETKAKTFKVTGKIHSGGSPITGLPPGDRPMVKFEASGTQETSYAKVSEDGAFLAELPAGNYKVTGSAGFMANTEKKGPGMVSKDLKVEADVANLDIDVANKSNKK
jgi:hypothetical protein